MSLQHVYAPPLQVSHWFNTDKSLSLESLKGQVVVLHAFQMLCPGCVSHGIPQASAIHEVFPHAEVAVIGLHTVFEHHDVMSPQALEVFMHEYRIRFPVAVDQPSSDGIPATMRAYGMQGTPSLILLDRAGIIRMHRFGRPDDLQVGAAIGQLLAEPRYPVQAASHSVVKSNSDLALKHSGSSISSNMGSCNENQCAI